MLVEMTLGTWRLSSPVGIGITTPVHLNGWSRALTARYLTLSALVFHANDGSLFALPPVSQNQRPILTGAGNLLIDGPTLLHVDPRNGARTVQTNGARRFVLSGVGA